MKILICLFVLFSFPSIASKGGPWAEVKKAIGEVTYEGQKVTKGMMLKQGGVVKTGAKSLLKFYIKKWKSTVVLGPNSQMRLNFDKPNAKAKYSFTKGICRWISDQDKKKTKEMGGKTHVATRNVAMGIRGTDFYLSYNPDLGETEIVMFDGKVLFQNIEKPRDKVLIPAGYWGGLGGRFGSNIQKPIKLSNKLLEAFARKVSNE